VTGRRTPLPPGFHARLAEALVSGSPETADAAMRAHVRYGFVEISGRIGALAASEWRERPKRKASR
jgi:DNA-binding GntR family transcriptional regulator